MTRRSSSPSRSHAPDRGEGRSLVLPHGPDGTHAGDRPDGCPRLLQAAGFEPEEAVSLTGIDEHLHRCADEARSVADDMRDEISKRVVSFPYAPRTGGAYDSHHRTAGIAGRIWRCGGCIAARGAYLFHSSSGRRPQESHVLKI